MNWDWDLWGPLTYQVEPECTNQFYFYAGVGVDLIEENVHNEISCVQVLRILIAKADAEIDELEESLVSLQCELAGKEHEEWCDVCCDALKEKIDCVDKYLRSLKRNTGVCASDPLSNIIHAPPENRDSPRIRVKVKFAGTNDTSKKPQTSVTKHPGRHLWMEERSLDEAGGTVKIGSQLVAPMKEALIKLLRSNMDLFMWHPSDIPSVDLSVISHRLNINMGAKPVVQRKRAMGEEQRKVVKEVVDMLLGAGFIWEVRFQSQFRSDRLNRAKPTLEPRGLLDINLSGACQYEAYWNPLLSAIGKALSTLAINSELVLDRDQNLSNTFLPFNGIHHISSSLSSINSYTTYTPDLQPFILSLTRRKLLESAHWCFLQICRACSPMHPFFYASQVRRVSSLVLLANLSGLLDRASFLLRFSSSPSPLTRASFKLRACSPVHPFFYDSQISRVRSLVLLANLSGLLDRASFLLRFSSSPSPLTRASFKLRACSPVHPFFYASQVRRVRSLVLLSNQRDLLTRASFLLPFASWPSLLTRASYKSVGPARPCILSFTIRKLAESVHWCFLQICWSCSAVCQHPILAHRLPTRKSRSKPELLFIIRQSECQSDQRHVRTHFGGIPLKLGHLRSLTDAYSNKAPEVRSTDK
ncbi:hypothetical protein CRG98_004217 [Punica granatum]|uniref:Reverse transcriptase domain-containing protein n=1 Tax=Punica granatum TaxID=22663 RepID=A0A2I0L3V7_PUNGR|nr:hypothetical protein CRG98_004217 [Punica granatum]